MQHRALFAAVAAVVLVPAIALGQQKAPRRQAPIEIRGQVPTPQVVTVRPREVPAYSRRVLVPEFFDHDFWPSILPAYQLVPARMLTGRAPADSALLGTDSVRTDSASTPSVTPAPNSVTSPAPADSTNRTPAPKTPPAAGTSSALPASPASGTARARVSH